MIGVVLGAGNLRELFDEKYYTDLDGGILEAFGRLFKNDLRLYVYPVIDPRSGDLVTVEKLEVAPHLQHLHAYLVENRFIEGLDVLDRGHLSIFPRDVLAMIQSGQPGWEELVPEKIADLIKKRKLLQYREPASTNGEQPPS